jgi:hypothetical protein
MLYISGPADRPIDSSVLQEVPSEEPTIHEGKN